MLRVLGSFFLLQVIYAEPQGHAPFIGPREMTEQNVAEESAGHAKASSGRKFDAGIGVEWKPEETFLYSKDKKRLEEEAVAIQNSLKQSALGKDFIGLVKTQYIKKNELYVLDLTSLLAALKRKITINGITNTNCGHCYAFVKCFTGQFDLAKNIDTSLGDYLVQRFDAKKNDSSYSPFLKVGLLKINYLKVNYLKKNRLGFNEYHAFIRLSPLLNLEKKGSGPLLIRPLSATLSDYQYTAKSERESFRLESGRLLPFFGAALDEEYWQLKKN